MNTIETTGGQTDQSISATDAAVEAAKAKVAARRAAKAGTEGAAPAAEGEKAKRKTYTPEERLERAANLEKERAERAQKRKDDSAAKREKALAERGTPHMSKVAKAGAGLAAMDSDTEALFNEIKGALGAAQIDTLVAHLAFHSRSEATKGSLELKLEPGTPVRIISGPAKLIGKEGIVAKWQRVHCYITVPGLNKPAYLFNANVEAIPAAASEPEAPASGEQASDETIAA